MDSQRLRQLMKNDAGSIKAFALKHGLRYTTIYEATKHDERIGGMSVNTFMSIAQALGMSAEELIEELSEQKGNQ